jgi:endonuclease YncB( thermonuclease family)
MSSPTVIRYLAELTLVDQMRVVDGDTFWAYAKVPYRKIDYVEYRLDGWDTPEKQGPDTTAAERMQAKAAQHVAENWFRSMATGFRMLVETRRDPEKYGRWLATVWAEDGDGYKDFLGEHLASLGLAVPSDGTKGTRWRDTYGERTEA